MTDFRLEQVAEGAWAAISASDLALGNAGIVDLGGETLVFDTFWTPRAARGLVAEAERLGLGPVRLVANSHWHGDHVRGNQVFEEATIVATANARANGDHRPGAARRPAAGARDDRRRAARGGGGGRGDRDAPSRRALRRAANDRPSGAPHLRRRSHRE